MIPVGGCLALLGSSGAFWVGVALSITEVGGCFSGLLLLASAPLPWAGEIVCDLLSLFVPELAPVVACVLVVDAPSLDAGSRSCSAAGLAPVPACVPVLGGIASLDAGRRSCSVAEFCSVPES